MKNRLSPLLAATGFLLAACNTTSLEKSWTNPEIGPVHFTKVIVMCIAPVDSLRKPVEDLMKAEVKSVPAVTSYELLPKGEDAQDPAKLAAAVTASGADGIIILRLASTDTEVGWTAGAPVPMYYRSYSSYYSYNNRHYYDPHAAFYYDPPTMYEDHIYMIETNIYDAKTQALVWSGITKSKNPGELTELIAGVGNAVRNKLRSQNIIP